MAVQSLKQQKCRVGNLSVEVYDAESSIYTKYTDIITSAFKTEWDGAFQVSKLTELGTVFRFKAIGYETYVEDGFDAAVEAECVGASRIVMYPTSAGTGYPRYVSALWGWRQDSDGYHPYFWGDGYRSKGVRPSWNVGGVINGALVTRPEYFYATFMVYDVLNVDDEITGHSLGLIVSTEPTFKYVSRLWPAGMMCDLDSCSDGQPFIMPLLTLTPFYKGENNFLNGLSLGLCGTGVPSITASADFSKGYVAGSELRRNRN